MYSEIEKKSENKTLEFGNTSISGTSSLFSGNLILPTIVMTPI